MSIRASHLRSVRGGPLDQVESPGRRWSLYFSVTGLARFARLAALCRARRCLHVLAAQATGALKKHSEPLAAARVQVLLLLGGTAPKPRP